MSDGPDCSSKSMTIDDARSISIRVTPTGLGEVSCRRSTAVPLNEAPKQTVWSKPGTKGGAQLAGVLHAAVPTVGPIQVLLHWTGGLALGTAAAPCVATNGWK